MKEKIDRRKNRGNRHFGEYLEKVKVLIVSHRIVILVVIISLLVVTGISYGAVGYQKISKAIEQARQFTKEEKFEEAISQLSLAQISGVVKIGIKKQEINTEIEKNKKLIEEKLKYDDALSELNEENYQGAITSFSNITEDSPYYQKAQTKIEEAKRRILEGELSGEKIVRKKAEAKAQQEKFEKELKTKQLADKEAEEKMMNADNDGDSLTYRRELELGTSDWNIDSDGDGIIDNLDMHPAGGDRLIAQHFEWNHGGKKWTWDYSFPSDWYDYYKNKKHGPHGVDYVTSDNLYIKQIAEMLKKEANNNNYTTSEFAISFIQSLSYVGDEIIGYDDYPKYPLETLAEQNGDCEDTSYLAAAIVTAMGIDCRLAVLPGHMALVVAYSGSPAGYYYSLSNGRDYYYFETTNKDFKLGDIPNEHRYNTATLIEIPSGTTVNAYPQYKKPCDYTSDFPGYYFDGKNFYSDSQCNNIAYCLSYKDLYYYYPTKDFYWDGGCSQIVVKGCAKDTSYSGYFTNGIDYYYDSRCLQKARVCRFSSVYYDRYWDGSNFYWDSSCTQAVVAGCSKSSIYPGYFFDGLYWYSDYRCTQKTKPY